MSAAIYPGIDHELSVVQALIADPASFREAEPLFAEHFLCPALGAITEMILDRRRINLPAGALDIMGELQSGVLDIYGGSAFLHQLELQGHPGVSLALAADAVRAAARLRHLGLTGGGK